MEDVGVLIEKYRAALDEAFKIATEIQKRGMSLPWVDVRADDMSAPFDGLRMRLEIRPRSARD